MLQQLSVNLTYVYICVYKTYYDNAMEWCVSTTAMALQLVTVGAIDGVHDVIFHAYTQTSHMPSHLVAMTSNLLAIAKQVNVTGPANLIGPHEPPCA